MHTDDAEEYEEPMPALLSDVEIERMRASALVPTRPSSALDDAYEQAFMNHSRAMEQIGEEGTGDNEDLVEGVFIDDEKKTTSGENLVGRYEAAVRALLDYEEQQLSLLVGNMRLGEGNAGDHASEAPADAEHNRIVTAVADETNELVEQLGKMGVQQLASEAGLAVEQVEPMREYEKWAELIKFPEQQEREKAMFEQLAVRYGPDEARAFMYDADYMLWCMHGDMIDPETRAPVPSWIYLSEFLAECHTFESAACEYHHYAWPGVHGLRKKPVDEAATTTTTAKKPEPVEPLTAVIGLSRRGTAAIIVDRTQLATLVYRQGEPDWQLLDGYELPVQEWGAPECQNIDRDMASLLFKRGATSRIDLVAIPSGAPTDRTVVTRSLFVSGVDIVYVIANNMWLMMLTADGRWAAWSVTDDSFRTPFEQLLISTRATPKVDPASASSQSVNPMTGQPMEPEEPALRTRTMHVLGAFFDDLDGCAFVLSAPGGSCFRGRLPTLAVGASEEQKAELRSKMRLQYMLSPTEIKMGTDSSKLMPGQPVPAKPTRESAINMCMRSVLGDNPDFSIAQASESSISYMSKSGIFDRQHRPNVAARRGIYQATDQEYPCNCVSMLGTLLVAHSSSGEVLVFSMLATPHGQNALCKSVADPNIPAVSKYYPSLYLRSRHITCLMPDGSLLVFKAALRTLTKASKAQMVTAGNALAAAAALSEARTLAAQNAAGGVDIQAEQAELLAVLKAEQ